MNEIRSARDLLAGKLDAAIAAEPLTALSAIGEIQRDLEAREREAVRAAIQRHSWTEIGAALGVSKQAAHQRLAKAWAAQIRDELKAARKAHKAAMREGRAEEAAAARARCDALVAEFKNGNRRRKAA